MCETLQNFVELLIQIFFVLLRNHGLMLWLSNDFACLCHHFCGAIFVAGTDPKFDPRLFKPFNSLRCMPLENILNSYDTYEVHISLKVALVEMGCLPSFFRKFLV